MADELFAGVAERGLGLEDAQDGGVAVCQAGQNVPHGWKRDQCGLCVDALVLGLGDLRTHGDDALDALHAGVVLENTGVVVEPSHEIGGLANRNGSGDHCKDG